MNTDFTNVTEQPGHNATKYQMSAMMTRYHHAASKAVGKNILEVACGSGTGLAYMAQKANKVVGGDIDPILVKIAADNHKDIHNVEVIECDAEKLPFEDNSFDMILLYEAIYYIPNVAIFMSEAKRVLTPSGEIIIVSVNREWHGFNASPFSIKYYSASELSSLYKNVGMKSEVSLAYDDTPGGMSVIISVIRKIAVALHLIPDTMEGKEKLKRLFYGKLKPIPSKIYEGWAEVEPLVKLDESVNLNNYKVIYITGTK